MDQEEKERIIKHNAKIRRWYIFTIILLFTLYKGYNVLFPEIERVRTRMSEYLETKYGEEFQIEGLRKTGRDGEVWYETYAIYPKRYVGTEKEYDRYYHSTISARDSDLKRLTDGYTSTLANHAANEYYREKLEELFGKNVVSAIVLAGNTQYPDFEREMERRRAFYREYEELEGGVISGNMAITKGAIYIYGRVENEFDREEYRKKIYEFIQYMKKTDTFDYVDLGIIVVDERILTDEFFGNNELKEKLIQAREELEDEEFRIKRREIMKDITEEIDPNKLSEKLADININWTYKAKGGVYKSSYYNTLLYSKVYSPKYILSRGFDDEKITNFEKINDVEFKNEDY